MGSVPLRSIGLRIQGGAVKYSKTAQPLASASIRQYKAVRDASETGKLAVVVAVLCMYASPRDCINSA